MSRYRAHQLFVALLLVGYFALGATFRWTRSGGELFPIGSWALFLYVPNTPSEYDVEIAVLDGEPLEPPVRFHAAKGLVPGAGRFAANVLWRRMGRAIRAGDEDEVERLRWLFERRHLGPTEGPSVYTLVRDTYSPVDRWRSGATLETVAVRTFAAKGAQP